MRISLFLLTAGVSLVSGLSAANYCCDRYPGEYNYDQNAGYYSTRKSIDSRDGTYGDQYGRRDSNYRDSNYIDSNRYSRDGSYSDQYGRRDSDYLDHSNRYSRDGSSSDRYGRRDSEYTDRSNRALRDGNYADQYARDDEQVTSQEDRDLMNRIRLKLEGDGSVKMYRNLDIKVSQGIVTLRGSVDRDIDRKDLKSRIENIDGVKRVNDKLEANDQKANDSYSANSRTSATSDREVSQRIQDALKSGNFSKGYDKVTADVNNGRVTLRGTVNSDIDRQKAQDMVQRIDGVESVDNQVTVSAAKY